MSPCKDAPGTPIYASVARLRSGWPAEALSGVDAWLTMLDGRVAHRSTGNRPACP